MEMPDIKKVVKIHIEAFNGFFLTFLGPQFLEQLYMGIQTDSSGISYIVTIDGEIAGFVAGTDQPAGFYKRLIRHRLIPFFLASILPALQRPVIIPRLLRAFRKTEERKDNLGFAKLMSIAISPLFQGKGIGKILLDAFITECIQRDISGIDLETDSINNISTNKFYLSKGFQWVGQYQTPEGREMNQYQMLLIK